MPVTSYPFTTPGNYTLVNTEVVAGKGQLTLTDETGLLFNEDFNDSTGHTFVAAELEFAAGVVRQLDVTPANSTLFSEYSTAVNANWADGATAVTENVGPVSVSGGRLDLKSKVGLVHIGYAGLDNGDSPQVGAFRFDYIPNYTGSPADDQGIFHQGQISSSNNELLLFHESATGDLILQIRNSTGVLTIDASIISTWAPTAGVSIEMELNYDLTAGATRVFFNGVQQGATITTTVSRTNAITIIRVGTNKNGAMQDPNFEIDNFLIFDVVQHTSNYTPSAIPSATRYVETTDTLPTFNYTGLGFLQSLSAFSASAEAGNPRYIMNVAAADLYWNGSAWSPSDGSYAQANIAADVNTNAAALTAINGESSIIQKVVFPAQTTLQGAVGDTTLTYTGQEFNATGTLVANSSFLAGDINSFTVTENEPGSDETKYAWRVDGNDKYWSGAAWVASDLSEGQTNDLATAQANIATLLTQNSGVQPVVFLKSFDGTTTPDIDLITVDHEFGVASPTAPAVCSVFGFLLDALGNPVVGATVEYDLNIDDGEYAEASAHVISLVAQTTLTDATGFFTKDVIRSTEFEGAGDYKVKFTDSNGKKIQFLGGDDIIITVPNQASADITTLITQP